MKWRCKNRTVIEIAKMTDSHLLNTVRYLRRNAGRIHASVVSDCYSGLSFLQGEMATFYAEQEIDILEETNPDDLIESTREFQCMLKEMKKRKLKELPI